MASSVEIVVFPVEVDITNGEAVGGALRAAFRPGVSVVIADLSATEFCDSSAIGDLILAHVHAVRSGSEMRVIVCSPVVLRILRVLGADQVLKLYSGLASALT